MSFSESENHDYIRVNIVGVLYYFQLSGAIDSGWADWQGNGQI